MRVGIPTRHLCDEFDGASPMHRHAQLTGPATDLDHGGQHPWRWPAGHDYHGVSKMLLQQQIAGFSMVVPVGRRSHREAGGEVFGSPTDNVFRVARERNSSVMIVAMSGRGSAEIARNFAAIGACLAIEKPFASPADLRACLTKFLDDHTAEA